MLATAGGLPTKLRALGAGLVLALAPALVPALALGTTLPACSARDRGKLALGPPPALPEQRLAARFTPLPEWYWEPVESEVRAATRAIELPVAESSLVRIEGATRVWDDLGAEGRERLGRDGLVVLGRNDGPRRTRMGAFYMDIREQRTPYVVTLDALVYAVHLAFEKALAEIDDTVLAPELDALLRKLETRLAAEQKGAGVELGKALELARAVIAVGRGLAGEGVAPPSGELGPAVAQEIAKILAHAGPAESPLLGAPIDYASFAVPSGAARPGSFRALEWLASAPLALVAESEAAGAVVGVATSRLHARTAMLLARVAERDVDPAIHASWSRLSRLLVFLCGPSDDLGPAELSELAASINVMVEDPKHVANVVTVDRLRHRAARGRAPLVFDGAGVPGRAGISMRLLGGHAPADSVALAAMTAAHEPALPSTLDLAVWLGAPEARASLHEGSGDALAGYDAVLARALLARPTADAPSRHASVYGSQLDVVSTWMAPREDLPRALASPAAQRAAIESALAAWTFARHDAQPLSRPRPSRTVKPANELQVSSAPLPAFVEAAPEVLARLVATVGQMKRGLGAIGGLPATSPGMIALAEVDDLLRAAMRVAARGANDEVLSSEDAAALASLPARLARLEDAADEGTSTVPMVAEIFRDASGEHVVSTATGVVEPAVMIVREPGTARLMLAVGAHVAHHELVETRAQKSTDAGHRARFGEGPRGAVPGRAPFTAAFRMVR